MNGFPEGFQPLGEDDPLFQRRRASCKVVQTPQEVELRYRIANMGAILIVFLPPIILGSAFAALWIWFGLVAIGIFILISSWVVCPFGYWLLGRESVVAVQGPTLLVRLAGEIERTVVLTSAQDSWQVVAVDERTVVQRTRSWKTPSRNTPVRDSATRLSTSILLFDSNQQRHVVLRLSWNPPLALEIAQSLREVLGIAPPVYYRKKEDLGNQCWGALFKKLRDRYFGGP